MRQRAYLVILVLTIGLAAFDAAPANAATPLYPDLRTLPPRDLQFDTVSNNGQSDKVLRFSNTVWNQGPGRLEVRGQIDPNTRIGPAVQRVYDDAGGYTDYTVGQFEYHPAHDHYHFEDWGRYQLWTKADYDAWVSSGGTTGSPIIGTKTTSCIIDEEFIRQVPRQPYPPVYNFRGCQPDSNWQMLQGISPGWGDTYDYFRAEQWIDLGPGGSLPDGQYVLRSVFDPLNKIYESPGKGDPSKEGGQDNAAITNFSLQGGQIVDSDPPSGSVMINNIAEATTNPAVTVKVLGRDDVSGVTQVRLSNNGTAWSSAQPYTGDGSTPQSIGWDLSDPTYGGTSADGIKTVYVEFKDASGKWSAPETDTINLDRTGASSAYSNAVLGDSPAAYWRFGESSGTTALDATGGDNGAYRNGVQLAQSSLLTGDPNTSAHFDGANDFVNVPSSTALSPPGAISLEAWINPDSLPASGSFASIISKPGAYSLQLNGPSLELTIFQSGAKRRLQAPAGTLQAGHTYHVVGTYDGSTQRLYVDGTEVASKALTGAITTDTNNVRIGSWGGGSQFFAGRIDEPAVYTAALSSSHVSEHHQAGIGGPPPSSTVNAPSDLKATPVSDTRIDLSWTDNATNEDEFLIQRDTNTSFTSPTQFPAWADATSISDTGLAPNTTYYYRIRAKNPTDSSDWSNTASATTMSTGGSSAYSNAVLGDSPAAYWRFGESSGTTALDATGGDNGTYRNGPALGQPSLLAGDSANGSVQFDGTNDYVNIPSSSALSPPAAVSLEAWIHPDSLPAAGSFRSILTKPGSYTLQFNGPQLGFDVFKAGGGRQRLKAPTGTIQADQTYHVVGTYDGTTMRLYVDGSQVANSSLNTGIAINAHPARIGSWSGSSEFFAGRIDEPAVYTDALSAAQVSEHHQTGIGGP